VIAAKPGHLADLLQVILDRVYGGTGFRWLLDGKVIIVITADDDYVVTFVARMLTEPGQETGSPGTGVVTDSMLPRQVLAELRVEIGHEQALTVLMCACAGGHDGSPFPLSWPNG
jgi:hypothetical protein